jgi:DNA-binding NarL/FixJ family response regulator
MLPRLAVRTLLESAEDLRLVGEASSGADAVRAVSSLHPDIVLMDVHMPGMDGPATAREVLASHPNVKVVAWTVSEASDDLLRMIQAGCSGYVLKDAGPSELQRALHAALRSESPLPRKMIPDVLRRVMDQVSVSQPPNIALTSREMQILRDLAKGFTTKRIAQDLGIRVTSVDSHLRNIFRKLDAKSRGEAVSAGMRLGLITLSDL